MTLKQQRDKDMEEFKLGKTYWDTFGNLATKEIEAFINQIYINIAKGEIERLEVGIDEMYSMGDDSANAGYFHAIQEEIAYWQDQLNSLTKE